MTALRVWITRLVGTLTGRRREDELREELETHLELLADEHRRRGLSDAEARFAARRELGGVDRTRESFRETRRLPSLDACLQDARFAFKALRRERATTLTALALLTVGVSSTVVLADVLDRLLLRPPAHVDDPSRVRRIYAGTEGKTASRLSTNYVTMVRLADELKNEVEAVATYANERISSGRGADAGRFEAVAFSETYFDVLGVPAALGSLPSARMRSDPAAVVISHALWQQRFGGAPDVLGRSLRLGQRAYTVVAVLPRGFAGIDDDPVDVWVPLESRRTDPEWRTGVHYFGLLPIVRLPPGVDRAVAEAHATQVYNVVQRIARPAGMDKDVQIVFGALPPAQAPSSGEKTQVLEAVAAVSTLVLLMASGNVANLLILAGLRRTSELSLKAALGASRGRLLRELLLQAAMLAAAAGTAALIIVLTLGALVRRTFLPPLAATTVPLDARLVGLTMAICAGVALILGLVPAIRLSSLRTLVPGRTRLGRAPSPLLDTFVAFQVALSVPLVVGTVLFVVSFWRISQVDLGFEAGRVIALRADMVDVGRPAEAHDAHRRMQARLAGLPGVASIALAQSMPLRYGYATWFEVPDYQYGPGSRSMPFVNGVDPAFVSVMGMRVVAGRGFSEADNRPGAPKVAIVNEAMVRTYWPAVSPIGRCIKLATQECDTRIIGVVAKASPFVSLREELTQVDGQFFVPIERFKDLNRDRVLLVRTATDPRPMLSRLRSEAQVAGTDLPYVDARLVDEPLDSQVRPLRLGWSIFLGLSALALVIAIAGLVVVTAHGVTRRTREMGIRLVLGAKPGDLVRLMARRTIVALGIGLIVGSAMAFSGAKLLRSLLFGIEPGDVRVFLAAGMALFVIGGVAAYIPARRTGRIDPSAVLRIE